MDPTGQAGGIPHDYIVHSISVGAIDAYSAVVDGPNSGAISDDTIMEEE